jgi:hypothetical protein
VSTNKVIVTLKHVSVGVHGSSTLNHGLRRSATYNATEVLGSPIPITIWLLYYVFLHGVVAESSSISKKSTAFILSP